MSTAEESMAGFVKKYTGENIKLLTRVELGASVQKAVKAINEREPVSFIVIGSTKGNSVKRSILGSTSMSVIDHARIPVITVPELGSISSVTHLLYPFNHVNPRIEIEKVVSIARTFSLSISIVSVETDDDRNYSEVVGLVDFVKKHFLFEKIEIELLQGNEIKKGIESHAYFKQQSLLAVFIHKTSPAHQVFTKSKMHDMLWHNEIPMLVIPLDKH